MTDKPYYPLTASSWDGAEYAALARVIACGQFTMANETIAYEREFAEYLNVPYCVAVNSGSTANLLVVAALCYRSTRPPLQRGDEVVVPAVSWPTTYFPLYQYGLRLKFIDVDLETLNYDLKALKAAVSPKTRVIMAVNLLGNPNDFAELQEIAEGVGAEIIEDNCESLGAKFAGRQAGTFGLAGTFSGFYSHHISTMEGGVICTSDEELYHIMLSLRAHGWTRDLPTRNRVTGTKAPDPFEESFKFVLPGYSVRPLEMSAAVGRAQLAKLDGMVQQRRRNACRFGELMRAHPDFVTQREIGDSSWFAFSMIVKPTASFSRQDVVQAFRNAGIECRPVVAGNFTKNPAMKWIDHEVPYPLTNADLVDRAGLFVGNRGTVLDEELAHMDRVLSRVARP